MENLKIENADRKSKWTLITIDDPDFLPGSTIIGVMKSIINIINFRFVAIDDVSGAKILPLLEIQQKIMEIRHVLTLLKNVVQFDWADFFLFRNYPNNWRCSDDMSYPEVIMLTDTTIRAVDDQYVYIYTPFQEIVEAIQKNYTIESIKTDSLENLDYPY